MAGRVRRVAKTVANKVSNSNATLRVGEPSPSTELRITNNWTTLHTPISTLLSSLRSTLTIPRKMYQGRNWVHVSPAIFITEKLGRFGTGLLHLVVEKIEEENVRYTIKDERVPIPELFALSPPAVGEAPGDTKSGPSCLYKQIDSTLFVDVGVTLRDYQVRAVNEALKNHRGIIKCATGGGKSWILAAILKALGESVQAVIVVNRRVLADQLLTTLKKAGIKNVGMFIGGSGEPNTVTICSIQTLRRTKSETQKLLRKARVLMVDEVHEYSSKLSRKTFFEFSQAFMRLGFSATPFKDLEHEHMIMSSFGPLIVDVSIGELVEQNVITNSVVNFYPISYPAVLTGYWSEALEKGIVYNKYFHDCVVALINSIPYGRIMVLVERIAHGNALHKLLPGSFWISGKDEAEARAEVLEKLRSSTDKKVVALVSGIGFVGVDVFVHHLINVAGGREHYLTIQKIGRGLRKANDKDILYYHDFLFTSKMNKMLYGQSLARIRTLKQSGYTITKKSVLLHPPDTNTCTL